MGSGEEHSVSPREDRVQIRDRVDDVEAPPVRGFPGGRQQIRMIENGLAEGGDADHVNRFGGGT